ncbi:MAG: hypothetical protein ACLQJR_28520 [Stellaceae bacterium]
MPHDLLARLAEIERCYDGPVPEGLRLAAHVGSAEGVELLFAAGEEAFYRSMVMRQLEVIRRRRADGSFYAALLEDLRYYRDGWRRWHRRVRALRAAAAEGQPSST